MGVDISNISSIHSVMVEKASNRERAIELRQRGLSRSQIAAALGLKSGGGALDRWLKGVPAPEWTLRPGAKNDLREHAIALRKDGKSYGEISQVVPVSKSTLSLWLRELPLTPGEQAALDRNLASGRRSRGAANRARRAAREAKAIADAASQVRELAESELFVAGVAAYWCEGAKTKPWRTAVRVQFINSDPGLIRLFVRWLQLVGVEPERITYRVAMHPTADEREARVFWASVVGVSPEYFHRTTLKKPNPNSARRHYADDYRGCLVIAVRRSTDLYRQIAGWWAGIVGAAVT
jgi:transcriptional regulator with XRE-family HTH domain